jgi:hypothetical protein
VGQNWKGSAEKEKGRRDYISDDVKRGDNEEKAKVGSRRAMRDGVRANRRGIKRGGRTARGPVSGMYWIQNVSAIEWPGRRNEEPLGRGHGAAVASSRLVRLGRLGGRAGLGDAASDRDPGAQQAQRSSGWGANVVAKVEYGCAWCWEM